MEASRTPERLLVVEQQADAPAGVLGEWAARRSIAIDVVRPRAGEGLPRASGLEAVAVLGSDASVRGTPEGWVADEVAWLRDVVAAGVPVLGLCFGAQALAAAMGGRVTRWRSSAPACRRARTPAPSRWYAISGSCASPGVMPRRRSG